VPLDPIRARVAEFYTETVTQHGETARGVDWNSPQSQQLRLEKLLEVVRGPAPATILDYGCGYGALVDLLRARGTPFRYLGFDISEEMIARARRRHPDEDCTFGTDLVQLGAADYAVASGVLNVKLGTPESEWEPYVASVLDELHRVSRRGFAFNALTSYSDLERRRLDLYYADPCAYFDLCKRRFSKQVALLHDYGLYEFTILVRKDA